MIAFEQATTSDQERTKQVRPHIGGSVEMVAGTDDLTADRGELVGIRAGDLLNEPAAIVEFERNGSFAIPVSMLFVPRCDTIVHETYAFILMRSSPHERKWMSVSFRVMCDATSARDAKDACF
jgi:hypothetical protein